MDNGTRVPGLPPARKKAGLTQVSLAHLIGVHPVTVARWETGERSPDLDTVQRLAAALGVQPGALLDEPEAPAEGAA